MKEQESGALVKRVTAMVASLPSQAAELVERIRDMRAVAHVLSPAVSATAIPSHIRINTVVDVIDTSFDPKTGRGNDVYFQPSIHKSQKQGYGDDATFTPLEVSLNATCIKRVMAGAGVSVTESKEIPTGERNYWKWQSKGKMRDFDGSWRDLPPGTAEIDLRDGSAQIGEWTPQEWAKREAEAAERAKTLKDSEKWKAKPKPINGWTADRVMNARRFGLRLAEAKSLNALGRNFGLKQVYTLEELQKPFVIFRATFAPDMNDPEIKKMVTASELGMTNLLYPSASEVTALPAHPIDESAMEPESSGGAPNTIDGHVVADEDLPFTPTKPEPPRPVYHVSNVTRRKDGGFGIFTEETGQERLCTDDEALANAAHSAMTGKLLVHMELEARGRERWIIEFAEAEKGGMKL